MRSIPMIGLLRFTAPAFARKRDGAADIPAFDPHAEIKSDAGNPIRPGATFLGSSCRVLCYVPTGGA